VPESTAPNQANIGIWLERAGLAASVGLRWIVYSFVTLWAAGAVYVDGPLGMESGNAWLAAGWVIVAVAFFVVIQTPWKRTLLWLTCILAVLLPWLSKSPSNDRDWSPDWARTGSAVLQRGALTFHNVRNFDYSADGSVTERWETRTMHLSNLKGVDYIHDAFGGDFIAHPILSFDFGPDGRIALSVETRREVGESFSKLGGFYKMFELQYLWGDERDLIRVRTNVRDEPVYIYRSSLTPEETLFILLDSVRTLNLLKDRPRFYNVISANCTTSLLAQTPELRNVPIDIRMIANGKFDELIYERGGFRGNGLPFAEMRERAFINPVAQAAHDDPDFSTRIREGRPGFE